MPFNSANSRRHPNRPSRPTGSMQLIHCSLSSHEALGCSTGTKSPDAGVTQQVQTAAVPLSSDF